MARNRQKAKERQARRKAQGQPPEGSGAPAPAKPPRAKPPPEPDASDNGREDDAVVDPHLSAGAPPEDVGRSDEVLRHQQDLDSSSDEKSPAENEDFVLADDAAEDDLKPGSGGHRDPERHANRPRFVQFLFAVRAELSRVVWPDRQALTTLTGVVLGFVLIAGGYLGLLDAIFSRIIQAIL